MYYFIFFGSLLVTVKFCKHLEEKCSYDAAILCIVGNASLSLKKIFLFLDISVEKMNKYFAFFITLENILNYVNCTCCNENKHIS